MSENERLLKCALFGNGGRGEWSIEFVSANCATMFGESTFCILLFFSLKAGVNKGEQGESNAEGMGCTQQELQQPRSF